MWEILQATILCLFAALGVVAFVKALILKILKPKLNEAYIVFKPNKSSGDIEYALRSLEARCRWSGSSSTHSIIIVDSGLTPEQRRICLLMCRESELYQICTPIELYKIFAKKTT